MSTSGVQQDSSLGFRKMHHQIRAMLSHHKSQPGQRRRCQVKFADLMQHGLGLLMTSCLNFCRISNRSENRSLHPASVRGEQGSTVVPACLLLPAIRVSPAWVHHTWKGALSAGPARTLWHVCQHSPSAQKTLSPRICSQICRCHRVQLSQFAPAWQSPGSRASDGACTLRQASHCHSFGQTALTCNPQADTSTLLPCADVPLCLVSLHKAG